MVGSALCSAQFFRAERSSYDVSLVLCFVDFVVVYGLVRKAPSLSSPVDIASLAWPFRDEQSSYDGSLTLRNSKSLELPAKPTTF